MSSPIRLVFGDDPRDGGFRLREFDTRPPRDVLIELEAKASLRPGVSIHEDAMRLSPIKDGFACFRYSPLAGARLGSLTTEIELFEQGGEPVHVLCKYGSHSELVARLSKLGSHERLAFALAGLRSIAGGRGRVERAGSPAETLALVLCQFPAKLQRSIDMATCQSLGSEKGLVLSAGDTGKKTVYVEIDQGGDISSAGRSASLVARLIGECPEPAVGAIERMAEWPVGPTAYGSVLLAGILSDCPQAYDWVTEEDLDLARGVFAGVGRAGDVLRDQLLLALLANSARTGGGKLDAILKRIEQALSVGECDPAFVSSSLCRTLSNVLNDLPPESSLGLLLAASRILKHCPNGDAAVSEMRAGVDETLSEGRLSYVTTMATLRRSRKLKLLLPELALTLAVRRWSPVLSFRERLGYEREAKRHFSSAEEYQSRLFARLCVQGHQEAMMSFVDKFGDRRWKAPHVWHTDVRTAKSLARKGTRSCLADELGKAIRPSWGQYEGGDFLFKVGRELDVFGPQDEVVSKQLADSILETLLDAKGGGLATALFAMGLAGNSEKGARKSMLVRSLKTYCKANLESQPSRSWQRMAVVGAIVSIIVTGIIAGGYMANQKLGPFAGPAMAADKNSPVGDHSTRGLAPAPTKPNLDGASPSQGESPATEVPPGDAASEEDPVPNTDS
mgnify:CR=1 FL=1